jgi:hypothetical protein
MAVNYHGKKIYNIGPRFFITSIHPRIPRNAQIDDDSSEEGNQGKLYQWKSMILAFCLITESATEKVFLLIMQLKSIYNKNLVYDNQYTSIIDIYLYETFSIFNTLALAL